ncbi:MAG: LL-diaminopimelate aminotransferase [Firmicutes bacterium]|nr:LL-diaminopimelate aminotransferase [Bacillota bacterium]MCL1954164.1 LL-diaminopimelate aminotransferase [Bacillota bacterium]
MKTNKGFDNLQHNYLFAEVAKRTQLHIAKYGDDKICRLGIGDVVQPLSPTVVLALEQASRQMGEVDTFKGYGEYSGYDFAKASLVDYYGCKGIDLDKGDVFVTDGAKSTLGLILDLFDKPCTVAIPNPVYPVYVDTNILNGNNIFYIDGNIQNNFLPQPPKTKVDIVYLCNPNNPTGNVYTRTQLQAWVDYALSNNSIILYDSAYEAFVAPKDECYASSIFQINGAKLCCIEIGSLSKTASFSGLRGGWIVISTTIRHNLNLLFNKLISFKTNGVSYLSQVALSATLSTQGMVHNYKNIKQYLDNAKILKGILTEKNIYNCGGVMSPYIWLQVPHNKSGWEFFDRLLKWGIVGTPGEGFGENGKGFFRLSSFANIDDIYIASQILYSNL